MHRFHHALLLCHAAWGLSPAYFKLIVVFTPWAMVLSSNQRAVTVLVCV